MGKERKRYGINNCKSDYLLHHTPKFPNQKERGKNWKNVKEGRKRRRREIKEKKEWVGEAYIHISCPSLQI